LEKHLHIISFNVPYPANYGGVVDVFYKLIALNDLGVKIHLHCFNYGREQEEILEKYCASVHYYKRETGHKAISRKLPYIVASRKNEELLKRLLEDDYPILMEGVHCSYLIFDKRFEDRKCFVRLHNVEYQYYKDLFKSSRSFIRKLYYWNESRLLHKYESELAKKAIFWGVTEKDNDVYRNEFGCQNIDLLPLYLPQWEMNTLERMGSYCLYHGDLSVDANDKAAKWLLKEVFLKLKLPLVIAGKNPSEELVELSHQQSFTCIVENPSEKEMQDMIAKAHINVLPSFTHTGMKIKLLNALTNGKHCVTNKATLEGTDLGVLCYEANTVQEFQYIIFDLFEKPFTPKEREKRNVLLNHQFNNLRNAEKQIRWIWGE
jgi:glycosyltransferase involved in cell wall biosynthesis